MGKPISKDIILSGRTFNTKEIKEIQDTVSALRNLSRKEMALTICEHLSWYQLNGNYKVNSSLKALEKLEALGYTSLPEVRKWSRHKDREIVFTTRSKSQDDMQGSVEQWEPIIIEPVKDKGEALLWNEYVERYHYLGYKQPFGAYRKYFIVSRYGSGCMFGCLLYDEGGEKQDCEIKAFKRLAKKIKSYFPQLKVMVLLDGLYPLRAGGQWSYHRALQKISVAVYDGS